MNQGKIIESKGYILSTFVLIFSWILFYSENGVLIDSFFAALLAAGLFWITYVLLRLAWLAYKRK